jgi:hypothetical protein
VNDWRPPTPVLWAPRFRKHLMRWLTSMDRRKAKRLAAINQTALDAQWRQAYDEWWFEHGWAEGAMTPDQAWQWVLDSRQGKVTA